MRVRYTDAEAAEINHCRQDTAAAREAAVAVLRLSLRPADVYQPGGAEQVLTRQDLAHAEVRVAARSHAAEIPEAAVKGREAVKSGRRNAHRRTILRQAEAVPAGQVEMIPVVEAAADARLTAADVQMADVRHIRPRHNSHHLRQARRLRHLRGMMADRATRADVADVSNTLNNRKPTANED